MKELPKNHPEPDVWKGALAGLVAGLVASWAMDRFQDVWLALSSDNDSTSDDRSSDNDREPSSLKNEHYDDESEDDASVKAASAVSKSLFAHRLTPEEKTIAGLVVHYAVGATSGIVYGLAAELVPEVTAGAGLPYGTAFWLVVDEGMVPLLRLSNPPSAYPLATHIYAFASHLVFGATAEGVRRLLRS